MTTQMVSDSRVLEQAAMPVEEEIRRIRMLPFAEACDGLARMARDLATPAGKQVELLIEGNEVEFDRAIVERLRGPLRHLVRNAIDHGIETPARRIAGGKPPSAQIRVKACLRGAQVEISISTRVVGLIWTQSGRGREAEGYLIVRIRLSWPRRSFCPAFQPR
jgi:two-component system, chemotaxis family, sensor kinase CheA